MEGGDPAAGTVFESSEPKACSAASAAIAKIPETPRLSTTDLALSQIGSDLRAVHRLRVGGRGALREMGGLGDAEPPRSPIARLGREVEAQAERAFFDCLALGLSGHPPDVSRLASLLDDCRDQIIALCGGPERAAARGGLAAEVAAEAADRLDPDYLRQRLAPQPPHGRPDLGYVARCLSFVVDCAARLGAPERENSTKADFESVVARLAPGQRRPPGRPLRVPAPGAPNVPGGATVTHTTTGEAEVLVDAVRFVRTTLKGLRADVGRHRLLQLKAREVCVPTPCSLSLVESSLSLSLALSLSPIKLFPPLSLPLSLQAVVDSGGGAAFEARWLAGVVGDRSPAEALPRTAAWLRPLVVDPAIDARDPPLDAAAIAAIGVARSAAFAEASRGGDPGRRTLVLVAAAAARLAADPSVRGPLAVPEVLALDADAVVALQNRLQAHAVVAALLLTANEVLSSLPRPDGTPPLRPTPGLMGPLSKRLSTLLRAPGTTAADLALEVARALAAFARAQGATWRGVDDGDGGPSTSGADTAATAAPPAGGASPGGGALDRADDRKVSRRNRSVTLSLSPPVSIHLSPQLHQSLSFYLYRRCDGWLMMFLGGMERC